MTSRVAAMFLFQLVFMDTAATIPTGAMAERWKFSAFAIYGVFMAAIIYPIYGSWVWGGGWLAKLGVNLGLGHGALDFAGSGVVHAVGGFVGLAGILVLGAAHRQVQGRRHAGGHPGPRHPARHPRHDHPGVRLDRLQRHVHAGRDRPALRDDHHQHDPRRVRRLALGVAARVAAVGQARSVDDRERHARRPRGHHRPVRVREPAGRGHHRPRRRPARRRRGRLRRARAQESTTRSARSRSTAVNGLWGLIALGPVRRRHVRRRLQRRRAARSRGLLLRRRLRPARRAAHQRRRRRRLGVRRRLRVLQGPERADARRHPLHGGGRARRPGRDRDGHAGVPRLHRQRRPGRRELERRSRRARRTPHPKPVGGEA